MKKSLLTLGVLAFAGITLFTSCKDEDGSYNPGKTYFDPDSYGEAIEAAAEKVADESKDAAISAATGTVSAGETNEYGVADDNVSAPTTNADGSTSTTQNFTDKTAGTTTTVTTTTKDNNDGSTTVTKSAETTDASGNKTTTETETVIKTDEVEGSLPTTTVETTQTVTNYDENGNQVGDAEVLTSTTTTSYKYTYEVDGEPFETEQEMLAALSTKTTEAIVVITLVETTTTKDFWGNETTVVTRTSTQVTKVPVPQGTETHTEEIRLPTSITADANGVSVSSGTVVITIVPIREEEKPNTHGGGGAQG